MKKASHFLKDLQQDRYPSIFQELYSTYNIAYQKRRYQQALEKFIALYGDREVAVYSTPGRSEVCGNHTDHQHGQVLAAAVDLDMIAVVAKNEHQINILSDSYKIENIMLDDLSKKENETETSQGLVRGVLSRFQELGYQIGGFTAYMTSDVLQGSGLSSSAAFEVMIGTILSGLYNDMSVDPVTIAQIGQYSENVYFEKPCGLMDQCACSVGSLIHIDFHDAQAPMVEKIDVDFSQFHHSLCIVDVHASHADLTEDYAAIPQEMQKVAQYFHCDDLSSVSEEAFYEHFNDIRQKVQDRAMLRAIHLFDENKRVKQAVQALKNNDFSLFKSIIQASGESSFDYLQNVYSHRYVQQQALSLALALSQKILGNNGVCRVHGGGFAGTIQAFVADEHVEHYRQNIEKYFGQGSCHVLKVRRYGGIKVMD